MGHLQIIMSHQGKKEAVAHYDDEAKPADDSNFLEERKQPSQKHKFKKKVKSRPVQALNEEYYLGDRQDQMYEKAIETPLYLEDEDSIDLRKKMRIDRLKKHKFKQKAMYEYEHKMKASHRPEETLNLVADPSQPDWIK
jgi:hypothetical protein